MLQWLALNNFSCYQFLLLIERECNESDIRLVGSGEQNGGHVEICLNGLWGSVCDDSWDNRDTRVLCQHIGFNACKFSSFLSSFL